MQSILRFLPGVHNGELIQAAQRGGYTFLPRRPMSLYLNEAIDMERAIQENGVISTAGFQQRYDSRYEAVQEFLADKKPVMITTVGNGALEDHSTKHTKTETLGGPSNRVWTANYEWSVGNPLWKGGFTRQT